MFQGKKLPGLQSQTSIAAKKRPGQPHTDDDTDDEEEEEDTDHVNYVDVTKTAHEQIFIFCVLWYFGNAPRIECIINSIPFQVLWSVYGGPRSTPIGKLHA